MLKHHRILPCASSSMEEAMADLPWDSDPDSYSDSEGMTLQAMLANEAQAILRTWQRDAYGDSYDQDTDAIWQAVMDGSIETAGEAISWVYNLPERE